VASKIHYRSLGTFEFLLNPSTEEFYFLEINPRLQVEHTITESICQTDIVKIQFQLAQGFSFNDTDLDSIPQDPKTPPTQRSIQLRITAEDPEKNYSLSIGKIQSFHFPSGNGIRVDTALVHGAPAIVSADFDSVIAKLIITASTWDAAVRKARRALQDTTITGIKTNLAILTAIISHADFLAGACDTQWLEAYHEELISYTRNKPSNPAPLHNLVKSQQASTSSTSTSSNSAPLFRPNDAWTLALTPKDQPSSTSTQNSTQIPTHHISLTRILRNDFPSSLSAEITHTPPNAPASAYTLSLTSTSSSSAAAAGNHRLGSASDPSHVIIPFAGTLVEVLVEEGDQVAKGDVVCIVRQMKMELEVRAGRSGVVGFVTEVEDGGEVVEGMLAAVIEAEGGSERAKL
jgi:acetyl/propionyl-CoA carboxylase alpha subunit